MTNSGKRKLLISLLILAIALLLLPPFESSILFTAIDVFTWLGAGGAAFAVMQVFVTNLSKDSRGNYNGA